MDRAAHLAEMLPHNVKACEGMPVEFIIVDYASQDPHEVKRIVQRVADDFPATRIRAYRYSGATHWNAAHAKNLSHVQGRGDVLVNIDADTEIRRKLANFLLSSVSDLSFVGCDYDNVMGTIGISRRRFWELNGHEEALGGGYGWEDSDLMHRAEQLGLRRVFLPYEFRGMIAHGVHERIFRTPYKTLEEALQAKQGANELRKLGWRANKGHQWAMGDMVELVGPKQ